MVKLATVENAVGTSLDGFMRCDKTLFFHNNKIAVDLGNTLEECCFIRA